MKKTLLLTAVISAVLLLGACSADSSGENYDYYISYISKDTTTLVDVGYEPAGLEYSDADTGVLIGELMQQLSTETNEVGYYAPLSGNAEVESYELKRERLYITFSEAYSELDEVRKVLTRCAIVRTMTQVDGVNSVEFYVGDEPVKDSKGNVVGAMKHDDIIMNPGEQINGINEYNLILYFADSTGEALVAEKRNVYTSANTSVEKLIVEELIKGPENEKLLSTIPEGTSIISVSFLDGVCFVNLSDGFLNQNYDISESAVIYSIVDSLTGLDEVQYVQISVNGDTSGVYREDYSFENLYERSLDIVK